MGRRKFAFPHLPGPVLSEEMAGIGFVVGLFLFVVVSCLSTASTAGTSFDYVLRGTVTPAPVLIERQDSAVASLQRRASRILLRGTI